VSPAANRYLHLARAYAVAGRRNDARKALQDAKTAGLKVEELIPLEQKGYQQLLRDLAKN
jgi:hypothetical protein